MKGNTIQRNKNIKRVLKEIRLKGPISKRELQEITGFSWGNICAITTFLSNENLIMASGKQETYIGRKPEEFDINITNNFILGIDFNSKYILITLCDLKGRVLDSTFNELEENTAQFVLEKLLNLTEDFLNKNIDKQILSISVAVQGEVDTEAGISVRNKSIDGWENIPISEIFNEKFGIPTYIFHDPDCLLYSEILYGSLKDKNSDNCVLLRIDHGVGIAVNSNGKMYSGHSGRTCEIGTTIVPFNKSFARLQDVIGEKAVSRMHFSGLSCDSIAKMARSGDMEAIGIFNEIGNALGFALNNVCSLLNSEKIVLFGEFIKYNDLFIEKSKNTLKDFVGEDIPEIILSKQNPQSAAVGAALFAADKIIDKLEFPD